MTIQQTVDIPVSRQLIIEVPREIPAGRAILAFTPVPVGDETSPMKPGDKAETKRFAAPSAAPMEHGLINPGKTPPKISTPCGTNGITAIHGTRIPPNATVLSNDPHPRDYQWPGYDAQPCKPPG